MKKLILIVSILLLSLTLQAQSQLQTYNYVISQFIPYMAVNDICVFNVDADNLATVNCYKTKVGIIDLSDVVDGDYKLQVPVLDISAIMIQGEICGVWYYKSRGLSKLSSCDPITKQLVGYPRE